MFWLIIIGMHVLAAYGMKTDRKVIGVQGKSFPVYDPSEVFLTPEQEQKRQTRNFVNGLVGIFFFLVVPLVFALVLA